MRRFTGLLILLSLCLCSICSAGYSWRAIQYKGKTYIIYNEKVRRPRVTKWRVPGTNRYTSDRSKLMYPYGRKR